MRLASEVIEVRRDPGPAHFDLVQGVLDSIPLLAMRLERLVTGVDLAPAAAQTVFLHGHRGGDPMALGQSLLERLLGVPALDLEGFRLRFELARPGERVLDPALQIGELGGETLLHLESRGFLLHQARQGRAGLGRDRLLLLGMVAGGHERLAEIGEEG